MPRFKGENKGDETAIKDLKELTFQERLVIGLERIKEERGWKNKDLAAKLGVHEGYMSQVVRGLRDVKLTMLDKMTRELGVSVYDLFGLGAQDLRPPRPQRKARSKKKTAEGHLEHCL